MKKEAYPCPCGGTLKWKRERIIQEGVDCGVLDVENCNTCGEEYLPQESMRVVEEKMKEAGLWGVQRKEIKFWKTKNSVTTRFPSELVKRLELDKKKKGYVYSEGKGRITIEF